MTIITGSLLGLSLLSPTDTLATAPPVHDVVTSGSAALLGLYGQTLPVMVILALGIGLACLAWCRQRVSLRFESERQRVESEWQRSERFMRSLVESLPQCIARKDTEGRFTFANEHFCRRVGKPMEAIIGKTVFDVFPRDQAEKYRRDDAGVMAGGKALEEIEENVNAAGEMISVQVIKTPLFDEKNCLVGLQVIVWDVTTLRRMETELERERELLRNLLENTTDAIYFKDTQSCFVRCSEAFKTLFNVQDLEELIGKTDFDFFTEEHARPAYEDEQEIIRTGQPILCKREKETRPDGRVTWALTSKMPWRSKDGRIVGTFGISRDITAMKEAEEQLEAAHKKLVDFSRQAGMAEVATNVLHNVGNVLNSINTSANVAIDAVRETKGTGVARLASMLEEHRDDLPGYLAGEGRAEKMRTYVISLAERLASEQELVLAELTDLKRNIDHIKEIVAMQQSYAGVCGVIERQQLPTLVEDALRMHTGGLSRHKVSVVRRFEAVPEILVDKHKVLQVLVNLISNAKYALSASTAEERQLTLSVAEGAEGALRVAIADNGIGIPKENLARIFAHGFTTKKDGHGFGLHSAALAAREMGGSLSAHSDGLGQGATFVLELPLLPPDGGGQNGAIQHYGRGSPS